MKINSILKSFLKKYYPTILIFILKNYFGLDFLNDFNPFSSETKEYFNGNNPQGSSINPPSEGEGSNRQNNPQDSSINPEEVKEVEGGVVVSGKTLEEAKALYEKNSEFFGKMDEIFDKINKFDDDQRRLVEEEVRILEKRRAEMIERFGDLEFLKNESQSDESLIPAINETQRQLTEDGKAFFEDFKKLKDKAQTHKAEVNKMFSELISKAAERIKDGIKESNSK